jgi:hypothetical protein
MLTWIIYYNNYDSSPISNPTPTPTLTRHVASDHLKTFCPAIIYKKLDFLVYIKVKISRSDALLLLLLFIFHLHIIMFNH